MIVSQTPLRFSFLGGGTDFPDFYLQHGGRVLTSAIDRYVFVIVKRRFDDQVRVSYTTTEIVAHASDVRHDLVRESLRSTALETGLEIVTLADVSGEGTGLGSSSTLLVGLLNALYAFRGDVRGCETLGNEASSIEMERLGRPVGKQDHYIAAYGGFRQIAFNQDGSVECRPVPVPTATLRLLNARLVAFFTGQTRDSSTILTSQRAEIPSTVPILKQMRDQCDLGAELLIHGQLDDFGRLLHEAWQMKKQLASGISNPDIDGLYDRALSAGALGGKVAGAGGGGFLLLYVPPENQESVRRALKDFAEFHFDFEPRGSRIAYHSER